MAQVKLLYDDYSVEGESGPTKKVSHYTFGDAVGQRLPEHYVANGPRIVDPRVEDGKFYFKAEGDGRPQDLVAFVSRGPGYPSDMADVAFSKHGECVVEFDPYEDNEFYVYYVEENVGGLV